MRHDDRPDQTRYPLTWPIGWRRTAPRDRRAAAFRTRAGNITDPVRFSRPLSVAQAIARLQRELDLLGATELILSTNVSMRLDGLPRSNEREPPDPGAAVYFAMGRQQRTLACDKWLRVADNIAAIAQHIDALRRIDRYGVGTMAQAFAGYALLTAGPPSWWDTLGVDQAATIEEIEAAYARLVKERHPDVGGTHDAMVELNRARASALEDRHGS